MSALLAQHGLVAVFAIVLAKQLGAPLPAMPLLLLAGASAARDGVFAVETLAVATAASMIADFAWFYAGRYFGRRVLALLCRISISPDSCVRTNEVNFARRGPATLVIAKFVPGLGIVAPPLAGAIGLGTQAFALFNGAGALLWSGSGIAAGLVFHAQIRRLLDFLVDLGRTAVLPVLAAAALYIAWRLVRRRRELHLVRLHPRVQPQELARMIENGLAPLILDVRARLGESAASGRIPGSVAMDLDGIAAAPMTRWAGSLPVIAYCDCPNDASAAKVATLLASKGVRAQVLHGGIEGWKAAGYGLEPADPGVRLTMPGEALEDLADVAARG